MALFSGDGAGCAARILKKQGAEILGGLHLKMPDCIGDEKILKKSLSKNKELVLNAEIKIKKAAEEYLKGNPLKEGLNFLYHAAGFLGQRLWFYNKTKDYSNKVKINDSLCIGCGVCIKICPMNNLSLKNI